MSRKIAISTLNGSTIDILNAIRNNSNAEYQDKIPALAKDAGVRDITAIGDVLYGYPALANTFISALVNRIAAVKVKSATFNNAYKDLKKGEIRNGETIEEVFVELAKAVEFNPEKGAEREFKRTLPKVRAAFHVINWKVMYPITIQQEDLRQAFLSMEGVQDLISRIIDSVYTAAEYDEYLLFKYLLIKAITKGKVKPVAIDTNDNESAAIKFRGLSNQLTFLGTEYNAEGVRTATPKEDQYIFMDSLYNATYDVKVLAGAFNMDKADFMGKLKLIDSWDTFDNERFDVIRQESEGLELVTEEELALMKDVKAVLVDGEWFQIYDNLMQMRETPVNSGLYWNYFYHNWKTISSSPFSNIVVFVDESAEVALPDTITVEVTQKAISEASTILVVEPDFEASALNGGNVDFVQTEQAVTDGIAVHKYGAYILPAGKTSVDVKAVVNGVEYVGATESDGSYTPKNLETSDEVGATFVLAKSSLI